MFNTFAHSCLLSLHTKEEQAEAIMWFCQKDTGNPEISLATINQYFEAACLPKLNVTRAKTAFAKSKNVCKGSKSGLYKLTLPAVTAFEKSMDICGKQNRKLRTLPEFREHHIFLMKK